MERYCCNVICGDPKTSEVKGLRDERQLHHQGNISDKFRKNPTSGLLGDVITRKSVQTYGHMDAIWSTLG